MSILLNFQLFEKKEGKRARTVAILMETERCWLGSRPTHSRCLDDRKYPRGCTKRAALHVFAPWPEENFPACVELLPSRERYEIRATRMETRESEGEGWRRWRSLLAFSFPAATYDHVIEKIEKWLSTCGCQVGERMEGSIDRFWSDYEHVRSCLLYIYIYRYDLLGPQLLSMGR